MPEKQIIYYSDELNDDFAGVSRNKKIISDNYTYINKNIFWRIAAFIVYRIIMTPVAYLYCKLKFNVRFINRKVLKGKKGYFLYGNHTQMPADGYLPTVMAFPVKPYVVVHPDSVAIKGTEQFMLMIGAVPLPSTLHGTANFLNAIKSRISNGNCIMIYPEAHIWPYCTKIRNFKSVSFKYPVKLNAPTYCFTTTYKQRKHRKKPRIEVFIDGPFFANENLTSPKQQQEDLRNQVYNAMCARANNSDCEYIKYIKKQEPKKEVTV